MHVLFIGDIVGPAAATYVVERLPEIRQKYAIDLVIANAENGSVSGPNPASGFGMSMALISLLFENGVDVITSGNHAWDSPEAQRVLEHSRVLRPYNLPEGRSGKGMTVVEVRNEQVTILNLADTEAILEALPIYPSWLSAPIIGTTIIDFHGGSALQKQAFAYAVDGKVAAVLGTHTHEPTLLLHQLPYGTALVTDVGMTGPSGGALGMDPQYFIAEMQGTPRSTLSPFTLAKGAMMLGAVVLRIEYGRTRAIERIQ